MKARTLRRVSICLLITSMALLMAFVVRPLSADEPARKLDIGLQLYSLRAQLPKDVPGTLAKVHAMGISDCEAAGTNGQTAEEFRKALDAAGLKASGVHFQWDRFTKDLDGVIRDAKALGCEYVTLPWVPHTGKFTPEIAHDTAAKFNEWGQKCAAAGLKFTYHAHGYEFVPYEGGTLFDVIAAETKPEFVNFELDIFWAYDGGADPVKLMEKYPARFPQMHLKDMRKDVKPPNYAGHEDTEADVALGKGQLDIRGILAEAQKIGVKHYYIEDESKESLEQIPQSIEFARSIGF